MNKKTLRKLTLSGVTLGVAALSLTSTTYAWFTTNGEAKATGISGSVTAAEANMLIKSPTGWKDVDGTVKPVYDGTTVWETNTFTTTSNAVAATFGQTTTLVNEAGNSDTITKSLRPVSILSTSDATAKQTPDGKFYELSDHALSTAEASSSCYLHYQVVIALSGLVSGKSYSVEMQLPELSSTPASQYLLVDAGTTAKAGKTIQVKIEDALSLGIKNTVITDGTNDYGNTTPGTITSNPTNNASGYYHAVEEKEELVDASNTSGDNLTGNAITYYNNVYGGEKISLPSNYANCYKSEYFNTDGSKWSTEGYAHAKTLYTVKGTDNGSFVCVTDLYFFIDGWDYQCFNAIGGLSLFSGSDIKFNLKATSNN